MGGSSSGGSIAVGGIRAPATFVHLVCVDRETLTCHFCMDTYFGKYEILRGGWTGTFDPWRACRMARLLYHPPHPPPPSRLLSPPILLSPVLFNFSSSLLVSSHIFPLSPHAIWKAIYIVQGSAAPALASGRGTPCPLLGGSCSNLRAAHSVLTVPEVPCSLATWETTLRISTTAAAGGMLGRRSKNVDTSGPSAVIAVTATTSAWMPMEATPWLSTRLAKPYPPSWTEVVPGCAVVDGRTDRPGVRRGKQLLRPRSAQNKQ